MTSKSVTPKSLKIPGKNDFQNLTSFVSLKNKVSTVPLPPLFSLKYQHVIMNHQLKVEMGAISRSSEYHVAHLT